MFAHLHKRMMAVDSSQTGTGKTVSCILTLGKFGVPFVVCCPKSIISHWRRWIEAFALSHLCLGVYGWEALKLGKYPQIYNGQGVWFERAREKRVVVFDEAHRAKSHKTLASRMLRAASEKGIYLVLLSATLIQSVLDLSGLAYPLKLITSQASWYPFARGFGARLHPHWRGYDDNSDAADWRRLYALLDPIRVRTLRSEVTTIVPVLTQVDLLDCGALAEIRAMYEDIASEVRALEALESSAMQIITARLRGRQKIELLKVPLFVQEVLRHLGEPGTKVAVFLNFAASLAAMSQQLSEKDVPCGTIEGSVNERERAIALEAFNAPGSMRVLLLNCQAGSEGISLHDTTPGGKSPRVALISPPESATVLIQASGRIGGRAGGSSVGLNRILFVAGTVEERVYDNVARKLNRLETLNDGELQPSSDLRNL